MVIVSISSPNGTIITQYITDHDMTKLHRPGVIADVRMSSLTRHCFFGIVRVRDLDELREHVTGAFPEVVANAIHDDLKDYNEDCISSLAYAPDTMNVTGMPDMLRAHGN